MNFAITEDSGFLGIIDPDRYEGFVAEDWTLERLFEHFAAQMGRGTLLLWATSEHGGTWTVTTDSAPPGARSVTGPIVSTRGRLCLVTYESLTMAAQFDDVTLPEPHMADLALDVQPGTYDCTVTQFDDDDSTPGPHLAVALSATGAARPPWRQPAWYDPARHAFEPLAPGS